MERKGKRKAHREKKRLERWTELGKEMDRDTDRKIETVKDKADVKKNRIMKRRGLKDGEKGKRERERERERELCVLSLRRRLPPLLCLLDAVRKQAPFSIPSSLSPSNSSSI